jgi:hypothetical protein
LFAINDTPLEVTPFAEVMLLVRDRNILKKAFKFMNSREYYRRRKTGKPSSAVQESKNNFMSTIRRSRVSQDAFGKKYVEYEIGCQLRVAGMRVQKDIVYKWNVWKRFSEFEQLNQDIRRSLGWQMDGIEFPSSHTFILNKFAPEFIEQRK